MTRREEALKAAQKHFEDAHPELSFKIVDGKKVRDEYYLDHPERSDTMTAFLCAVMWADSHPIKDGT